MARNRRGVRLWLSGVAAAAILAMLLSGCSTISQAVVREQGEAAMRRGDYRTARHKYERLVELNPTNAQYQYGLGLNLLQAGKLQEAETALEQAWSLAPNDPSLTPKVLDALARSLYRQEEINQLHAFLNETVAQYGNTSSYLRQAEYLTKTGDIDGARVAYRKATYFADSDNAQPYIEMADFYASINDRRNTVKALRYAHYISPRNPRIMRRLKQYGVQPGQGAKPPKPALLTDD